MAAWQREPPLLMQIRNLLAQLIVLTGQVHGNKIDIGDFIPELKNHHLDDVEVQRSQMLIWAAKHNATLQ